MLRAILAKAKEGTRVIYMPGNHDENIREFCGSLFGNVSIRRQLRACHRRRRELLVMHGDEFDSVVKCSRWLARFGSHCLRIHDAHQSRRESVPARCSACRTGRSPAISNYGSRTPCATSKLRTCRCASRAQPEPGRHRLRPYSSPGAAARSTACSIATTVTGSKAARRSSRPCNGELSLWSCGEDAPAAARRRNSSRSPRRPSVQLSRLPGFPHAYWPQGCEIIPRHGARFRILNVFTAGGARLSGQSAVRGRRRQRARSRRDAGAGAPVQRVGNHVHPAVEARRGAGAHLHARLRNAVRRPSRRSAPRTCAARSGWAATSWGSRCAPASSR